MSLEGIEIINLRHDREAERRERYARILSEKRAFIDEVARPEVIVRKAVT